MRDTIAATQSALQRIKNVLLYKPESDAVLMIDMSDAAELVSKGNAE
jgi:hypothetical protein